MSKAFTKDDAAPEPLARSLPQLQAGEKRYITADGFRRLQGELAELTSRPSSALSDMDKERAGWLTALLPLLTPVTPHIEDRVLFGARVTTETDDGEQVTYHIVGPDELAGPGDISVDAPLARALLGREEGDTVTVRRPKGPLELTILSVSPLDRE